MARLAPAYHGYNHQDVVAACALASILIPRSEIRHVSAERKATPDDRFDDLELAGTVRRRVQIKAHASLGRLLRLADMTTDAMDFRIDRAVRSVSGDSNPADLYTLFTTYPPANDLLPFLQPSRASQAVLPGVETSRYRLVSKLIWPDGEKPAWHALESVEREEFARFCDVFALEVGCPMSSGDLRAPGPLEQKLVDLLRGGIGVGLFPNDSRDVTDAAAHLICAARTAREGSETVGEQDVVRALALRIDYGRVEEHFPVNVDRLVRRADLLDEIVSLLGHSPRVAVTGSPGIGKSWLVRQLRSRLREEGWVVAAHYCFIDLFDKDRDRRASVATTFGSIIAELYDADRGLLPDGVPRFAAGPAELEKVLKAAAHGHSNRRIAIIVDGLDHVDRLPGRSRLATAAEIVEELAMLSVPRGIAVIIVSQPGEHLRSFLSVGSEYSFVRWPDDQIREVVQHTELEKALSASGLESETKTITECVVSKATGNPLYATYLVRTALNIIRRQNGEPAVADIAEHLGSAPQFDRDLNSYYNWLVEGLGRDTGVIWIAGMLALLDFALTSDEIKQIRPDFRAHVDHVLDRLAPVLRDDIVRGGVRIYHESFQRHMRARLDADQSDVPAILEPVIRWLEARGFFSDARAFRSVFTLLKRAGRESEIPGRIKSDFVALSVAYAQSGEAVMANLATAATVAASVQDWPLLARLLEISRACDYLYSWRLPTERDIAEEYGRAYAELFGAGALAVQLLHDGRCTFLPRPGLLLCRLCDQKGAMPPWREYVSAHNLESKADNSMYPAEDKRAIAAARLTGFMRLKGWERSVRDCVKRLTSGNHPTLPHYDVAVELGRMYGADAVLSVVDSLPTGPARAWARLALAEISDAPGEAKRQCECAIQDGFPAVAWLACLRLGADPGMFPRQAADLGALTDGVLSEDIQFHAERLRLWRTELALASLTGDEDSLRRAEMRVAPDSWFRRWLLFCLLLARRVSTPHELLNGLSELSENVEVFKGKPRACDLYSLHDEIRASFQEILVRLDSEGWVTAIGILAKISAAVSTWLQGSRSGPLPLDAMFDLCLETANSEEKRIAASELAHTLLGPEARSGEFYDTHARDSLLLARIHVAAGRRALAAAAWYDACTYLTGYGWHKDVTVYDVLDPLEALGKADPVRTRQCLRLTQSIVKGVLVHTDGKETGRAIHKWIDLAASIHPAGALSFLVRRQIGELPAFGDLDHAIPKALAALAGRVGPLEVAAGWLVAGSEARSESGAALAACEKPFHSNARAGKALWQAVIASLDGDGVCPASGLRELVAASSARLEQPEPEIESTPTRDRNDEPAHYAPEAGKMADEIPPPLFVAPLTPLQIASAVRKWRDTRSCRPSLDSVVNGVGWRVLEWIERGDETAVKTLIQRLARDVSSVDQDSLLPGLAEGLRLRGYVRLAAFTSTLAYISTRESWYRFGGSRTLFADALKLDPELTWSTFAEELAGQVARGGGSGVTTRLVQLLVAGGRVDEAFSAWHEVRDIVGSRLPRTGPADDNDVVYDAGCDDESTMLAAVIVTRINYLFVQEKRFAAAAAAMLARYECKAFSSALTLAVANPVPPWTLITLLHVLFEFEVEPYEATHAAASTLRSIAVGELVSARVLAHALLGRAGLPAPDAPPAELPIAPSLSSELASELVGLVGEQRIERINLIWPEFGRQAVEQMDVAFRSASMDRRTERVRDRFRLRRKGRRLQIWYPVDEEVEKILQITGSTARCALAKEGIIGTAVEEEIGTQLLGDTGTLVRLVLSRIVRPEYAGSLRSGGAGVHVCEPIIVDRGEFTGWVVAGFRELESKVSSRDSVEARIVAFSGVVFENLAPGYDKRPFAHGNPSVWTIGCRSIPPGPLRGPLSALEQISDPFGISNILVPHPILLAVGSLTPTTFDGGLTFIDPDNNPAVVCRAWRQRLIGDDYFDDREHRIEGIHLLVRKDVFEAASSLALNAPRSVTVAVEHREN